MSAGLPGLPDIYLDSQEATLLQGDVIADPDLGLEELADKSDISGLVVLNSSCDLVQSRIDNVVLSPARLLERLVQDRREGGEPREKTQTLLDRILKNNLPNCYFLPPTPRFGGNRPHYVDLQVYLTLPYDIEFKQRAIAHRVASLVSPSREKLAHTLGAYFSRVGLPSDQEVPATVSLAWAKALSGETYGP